MKFWKNYGNGIINILLLVAIFSGLTWSLKKSVSEEIYAKFDQVEKERSKQQAEKERIVAEENAKIQYQQVMKGMHSRTYKSVLESDIQEAMFKNCKKIHYTINTTSLNPVEEISTSVTHMLEYLDPDGNCMLTFIFRDISKNDISKKGKK